jgi:hypothetical protein
MIFTIEEAADIFCCKGITPVSISGDSINIDNVYVLVLVPNVSNPWLLKKWITCGTILKEVGAYKIPKDALDRYALDIKYKIS